jgi:hypothetical protein
VDNQSALEAANQASSDIAETTSGGWELAAMASVALATVLAVVGLWLM